MTRFWCRISWVVALTAALLVPGALPASAHQHPTPTEVSAPGVVYVEARVHVEVALVEHLTVGDPRGVHIAIVQSTSDPLLHETSGFVVDPTGSVVTSGRVAVTQADLDKASIYAVNEAFARQYPNDVRIPADGFSRQRIGDETSRLQQRLEACYPPYTTNDAGGCVVTAHASYVVDPHVSSQQESGFLPAELLGKSTSDVAVLRVKGSGMPTVAVGESMAGAQAVAVLGFTDVPSGPGSLKAINAHLDQVGGSALRGIDMGKADEVKDATALDDGLKTGMEGGPVVAEAGQVVGLLLHDPDSGPPPARAGRLVEIGTIRGVLSAENVEPRRGPVDTSFEQAMHAFKNGGYAASIPSLQKTLELYPGHAIAKADIAVAEQNVAAGTPGPTAPAQSTPSGTSSAAGFPWVLVLAALAALLLVAAAVVVLLRRRGRRSPPGGVTPSPGGVTPPAGGVTPPPGGVTPSPGGVTPPPGTAKPKEGRPKERQSSAPARSATGKPERQAGPGPAPRPRPAEMPVTDDAAPGRTAAASPARGTPALSGSAASASVAGQRAPAAVGDSSIRARGASSPQPSEASPGRAAPVDPDSDDRPAFCTSCGTPQAPGNRYCGRCGAPRT